jgi:3-methyladenine DNA glycosylase AlkD
LNDDIHSCWRITVQVVETIISEITKLANPGKATHHLKFFKTGPGEYGEGDRFHGLVMKEQRAIAKKYYAACSISDISRLLQNEYHECRMVALLVLVEQFKRTKDDSIKKNVYECYMDHPDWINNWDLVDVTAPAVPGQWLLDRNKEILYRWAGEDHLWKQRIAIMSTFTFLRVGRFEDTFAISDLLLHHEHDLIHKAVGWMIREVGNRDGNAERIFLKDRYQGMPRTMLRYAIEKFPEEERKRWLRGEI